MINNAKLKAALAKLAETIPPRGPEEEEEDKTSLLRHMLTGGAAGAGFVGGLTGLRGLHEDSQGTLLPLTHLPSYKNTLSGLGLGAAVGGGAGALGGILRYLLENRRR